jgi:hypothetical protein
MSADVLLARLEGVRRTGRDRWMARCPAHDDKRPSLAVRQLDDGRLLIHDFAGCAPHEVLQACDLDFSALFPRSISEHAPSAAKPWNVREVLVALKFELTLGVIILGDVASGKAIDRTRASEAKHRILRFLEELERAA